MSKEFREKLKSISFGVVPGGFQDENSGTMFDKDALMEQVGHRDGRGSAFSKERVMDMQSDFRRAQREFDNA